jgi:ABC-type multidrug transport system fused ATPase/permease subunit
LIAFVLLYLQVSVGFLAGVVIILVMIPLNRMIATKIGTATTELMVHKDARVKLITECFRSIKSIKMSGLEDTMAARSMTHRDKELTFLSQRKYLDAWCVFLWASLPLLVPYLTFVTTVAALNRQLTASEVFTTLALLNMLIFPMNAYPWIINGAVESSVSIRRLSSVLVVPTYSPDLDDQATRLDLGAKPPPGPSPEPNVPLPKKHSTLSSLFNGKADDDLGSEDLAQRKTSRSTALSLIEVSDLLVSWNEGALHPIGTHRSSSRDSQSSTDRLLDQQLILEDLNFVVGPVTLSGVSPGQVPLPHSVSRSHN